MRVMRVATLFGSVARAYLRPWWTCRRPHALSNPVRSLVDGRRVALGVLNDADLEAELGAREGSKLHPYRRAPDDGSVVADEERVHQLLAERFEAKRLRDFERADALQDELLRGFGVQVLDKRLLWGTFPKKTFHPYRRGDDGGEELEDEARINELLSERFEAKKQRDFERADELQEVLRGMGVRVYERSLEWVYAPNSSESTKHPFRRGDDGEPLAEDVQTRVDELIAERFSAKRVRDYDRADELRDILRRDFNIIVRDRELEWVVARPTRRWDDSALIARIEQKGHPYVRGRETAGDDLDEATLARIEELLAARFAAKRDRDFEKADGFRDTLRSELNVMIFDRENEWFFAKEQRRHPFVRGEDEGEEVADMERVEKLIALRFEAKLRRDYDTADAIRDELSNDFNIQIYDKQNQWTVGPRRPLSPKPASERFVPDAHDYNREPDDNSDVDVAEVDRLLLERLQAKYRRDFETADELKLELRSRHGVHVHDPTRTWCGGLTVSSSSDESSDDTLPIVYRRLPSKQEKSNGEQINVDEDKVKQLIANRYEARSQKAWDRADECLDELIYMGVIVNDDTETWRVLPQPYKLVGELDDGINGTLIERMLNKRRVCKIRKQYPEADAIRNVLHFEYGIYVDDKSRTYSMNARKKSPPSSDEKTAEADVAAELSGGTPPGDVEGAPEKTTPEQETVEFTTGKEATSVVPTDDDDDVVSKKEATNAVPADDEPVGGAPSDVASIPKPAAVSPPTDEKVDEAPSDTASIPKSVTPDPAGTPA